MTATTSNVKKDGDGRRNDGESPDGDAKISNDNSKSRRTRDTKYDSSDDEDTIVYRRHKRIVQAWFDGTNIDLKADKYKETLFKSDFTHQNLIHRAILFLRQRKKDNPLAVIPPKALDDIEKILLQKPDLFTTSNANEQKPIFEDPKLDASILFRVISMLIPTEVVQRLEKARDRCEKGSTAPCPLLSVSEGRRLQCRKRPEIAKKSESLNGQGALPQQPESGEGNANASRCIHDEVDTAKVLEEDKKLRKILKAALKNQAHTMCLQPLLTPTKFDRGQKDNTQVIPIENFKTLLQLCPDDAFDQVPESGRTPLHLAVDLYRYQSIDYELLFSVIESLVERCPQSIFLTTAVDEEKWTAYRLLKHLKDDKAEQKEVSRARAEELLKRICIGSRRKRYDSRKKIEVEDDMWAEKKDFLYWNAKLQQQFYLNLMGESIMLDKSYIESMRTQSGMLFETVLDFVRLPYWKPQVPKPEKPASKPLEQALETTLPALDGIPGEATPIEPDPYVAIFDWLWDCNVQKIFTVEVEDSGPEPHSNAAIREAFNGRLKDGKPTRNFEVEIWKWKKFDICCDTVATAVPAAREVYLYSRGNTAVLRGWACGSSLAQMEKLEKLVVEIYPRSFNDEMDCRKYEEEFKQSIKRQCPWLATDHVLVRNHGFLADQTDGQESKDNKFRRNGRDGQQHQSTETIPKPLEWLKRQAKFRSFMINLGLADKVSVKVALLDDGSKLHGLDGKQKGETFRLDSQGFFVGSCSHGTEMARCIRDVCPMAELYIARLDDSREGENQKFTIASCHQALQWALDMEVDIISMSWTFERKAKSEEDEHEKTFVALVAKAVASKTVLLFGSLPDQKSIIETHQFAPVGLENVIRIGSATVYGETSPENIFEKPNFILPGEQIKLSNGDVAKGSSFATAFAAGLAAMVLYCIRAHQELAESPIDKQTAAKALDMALTPKGMKTIFNILSQKNANEKTEKGAFVQPYHTFGQDFNCLKAEEPSILMRIVREILPESILRAFHN